MYNKKTEWFTVLRFEYELSIVWEAVQWTRYRMMALDMTLSRLSDLIDRSDAFRMETIRGRSIM